MPNIESQDKPFIPTPRKFKACLKADQSPDIISLAGLLCRCLGEVTGAGRPTQPALKAATHFIGNYLRALKRYPDAPWHYHFHYSRNEARLREDSTGFTPKIIDIINGMNAAGFVIDSPARPSIVPSGIESTFHFTPMFHQLMLEGMSENRKGRRAKAHLNYEPVFFSTPVLMYKENLLGMQFRQIARAQPTPILLNNALANGMRRQLGRYNNLLARTAIDFDFEHAGEVLGRGAFTFDPGGLRDSVGVYRRFSDKDMKTHGRIYGGAWMTMPSELRPFLTINGQPTVELDFQAMQPNLLFTKEGTHPVRSDPYEVTQGYQNGYVMPDQYRILVKEAFMYLFNSKQSPSLFVKRMTKKRIWDFNQFIESCSEYNREEEFRNNTEVLELYELFNDEKFKTELSDVIQKAWAPIWHYFEDREYDWRHITRLESDIAMHVINNMTLQGVPVLTIHDSFITTKESIRKLEQAMKESYITIMNADNSFIPVIKEVGY